MAVAHAQLPTAHPDVRVGGSSLHPVPKGLKLAPRLTRSLGHRALANQGVDCPTSLRLGLDGA